MFFEERIRHPSLRRQDTIIYFQDAMKLIAGVKDSDLFSKSIQ